MNWPTKPPSHPRPDSSRKFSKGPQVTSLEMFRLAIEGRRYVYIHDKLYHPSWAQNFQFGRLAHIIRAGSVHLATRNDAFPFVFEVCYHKPALGVNLTPKFNATCSELVHPVIADQTIVGLSRKCRALLLPGEKMELHIKYAHEL